MPLRRVITMPPEARALVVEAASMLDRAARMCDQSEVDVSTRDDLAEASAILGLLLAPELRRHPLAFARSLLRAPGVLDDRAAEPWPAPPPPSPGQLPLPGVPPSLSEAAGSDPCAHERPARSAR